MVISTFISIRVLLYTLVSSIDPDSLRFTITRSIRLAVLISYEHHINIFSHLLLYGYNYIVIPTKLQQSTSVAIFHSSD